MRISSQDMGMRKNGSIRVPFSSKRGPMMRKVMNPAAARRNKIPEERLSRDISFGEGCVLRRINRRACRVKAMNPEISPTGSSMQDNRYTILDPDAPAMPNPAAERRRAITENRVSRDIFIFFMKMTLTLVSSAFNGCAAEERMYPH